MFAPEQRKSRLNSVAWSERYSRAGRAWRLNRGPTHRSAWVLHVRSGFECSDASSDRNSWPEEGRNLMRLFVTAVVLACATAQSQVVDTSVQKPNVRLSRV